MYIIYIYIKLKNTFSYKLKINSKNVKQNSILWFARRSLVIWSSPRLSSAVLRH